MTTRPIVVTFVSVFDRLTYYYLTETSYYIKSLKLYIEHSIE